MTVHAGLDIGYSSTKAYYDNGYFREPSIVGTYEDWFAVEGNRRVIELDGVRYLFGKDAIDQSQIVERREDRAWIKSDMYRRLMEYAVGFIAMNSIYTEPEIFVVSGLPLAYFQKDAPYLKNLLVGSHRCIIDGEEISSTVKEAIIVPQPFGTLLDYALNDDGGILTDRARGKIGVIDIGGKTTNILSVSDLSEQSREATSVGVGGWTAVKKLRDFLVNGYPEIDDRVSNIEKVLVNKSFVYFGEKMDVSSVVSDVTKSIADQIKADISQRWGSAAQFEKILISGGGAHMIGSSIEKVLPQSFIVDDPIFSNVKGFYKFAKRSS